MRGKRFFSLAAAAWLRLSGWMGVAVSSVLLAAVFFLVVVPVGCIRRMAGKDSLRLKKFGKGRGSALTDRGHTYTGGDLIHTF
jgi:hypothetical protein